jgi:threonyl-tRNA synthetase
VQVWSAIGREFSIATNQVDFAVPKRFGLVYKDRDNTEKARFASTALAWHARTFHWIPIEHGGNFPLGCPSRCAS